MIAASCLILRDHGRMVKCGRGTVRRKAYVRRTRKGRTRDGRTRVPASCIRDVGNPGKGFKGEGDGIGPLRQGDLSQFGYAHVVGLSEGRRHLALARAVREYGALSLWRKLNAVYVYSKHTAPASSAIFKQDRDWVRAHYF